MDAYNIAVADREALEKFETNPPVKSEIELLREEIAELKDMLAPIGPVLAALPELMNQVGPLIEGAKKSPVLRMMGITIP